MKKILPFLLVFSTASALFAQLAQVPQKINYQGRVAVAGVNFDGPGQFKFALVDAMNVNQTARAFTMAGGSVISVFVNRLGTGYTDPPEVTIAPPETPGITALATATVENGHVTGITVTEPGSGYTTQPVVTIAPPPPNLVIQSLWSNDLTSIAGSEPATSVSLPVSHGLYSVALGDKSLPNMTEVGASVFLNPGETPADPQFYPAPKDIRLRTWFDDGVHGFQQLTPDQSLSTAPYAFLAANVQDAAITANKMAEGSISNSKLAEGAVTSSKVGAGAITPDKLFSTAPPVAGQFAKFNGTKFEWANQILSLPFSGSLNSLNPVFSITNTGLSGTAIAGVSTVNGFSDPGGIGVSGKVQSFTGGAGVKGISEGVGNGVEGIAIAGDGVIGRTSGQDQSGVFGESNLGAGVKGLSKTSGMPGVYAKNNIANGLGLLVDGTLKVNGNASFGINSTASALGALASGSNTTAAGNDSFTQGRGSFASGSAAIATGRDTQATAKNTATFGVGTIATLDEMIACGRYNRSEVGIVGNNSYNPLFVVGNGLAANDRANGFAVYDNYLTVVNGHLIVNGPAEKPGGGFWGILLSDGRWKDIQSEYLSGLDGVSKIRPVYFKYKEGNPEKLPTDKEYLGVIAQELQVSLPAAVITRPDGFLTIDQDQIFWAMVNSIKQLKTENDDLKQRIETENASLGKRLDALEALLK